MSSAEITTFLFVSLSVIINIWIWCTRHHNTDANYKKFTSIDYNQHSKKNIRYVNNSSFNINKDPYHSRGIYGLLESIHTAVKFNLNHCEYEVSSYRDVKAIYVANWIANDLEKRGFHVKILDQSIGGSFVRIRISWVYEPEEPEIAKIFKRDW